MRQIGTIATAEHARRFAAYLATEKIATHIEQDGLQWTIWARNEDQLETARAALERFNLEPDDARYRDAEAKATQLMREEQKKAEQARKNLVNIRSQWGGGSRSAFKRAPLTCVVIALCVFVYFLTLTGGELPAARKWLSMTAMFRDPISGSVKVYTDGYAQIRQGQVWRLITPVFLHFSPAHILFNMMMFYSLGSRIEQRYGSWRLGLMMLVIALLSNIAQYHLEGSASFGGLSGVVYGVFGFVWMKTLYDPQSGIHVEQQTVVIMIAWLFLCMGAAIPPIAEFLPWFPKIANTAHFVGLAAGMAICGLTIALRRRA